MNAVSGTPLVDPNEMSRRDSAEVFPPSPHRPQFEYTADEQAIIEQRLADLGYLE